MPVPIEFMRGVLGVLGVLFAHMVGRAAIAVRKGWQKPSSLYGWVIRATVCLAAVAFRHSLDGVDIGVWVLAAVAFAVGMWNASRQKPPEDLTKTIFPDEP